MCSTGAMGAMGALANPAGATAEATGKSGMDPGGKIAKSVGGGSGTSTMRIMTDPSGYMRNSEEWAAEDYENSRKQYEGARKAQEEEQRNKKRKSMSQSQSSSLLSTSDGSTNQGTPTTAA